MLKRDLQTGMVVTTSSGSVYLVWKDRLIRADGYLDLDDYGQDMKFSNRMYPQFDIVFVYASRFVKGEPTTLNDLVDPLGRECLWSQFEETEKQEKRPMTLYELEQELGYPVEIVEG